MYLRRLFLRPRLRRPRQEEEEGAQAALRQGGLQEEGKQKAFCVGNPIFLFPPFTLDQHNERLPLPVRPGLLRAAPPPREP